MHEAITINKVSTDLEIVYLTHVNYVYLLQEGKSQTLAPAQGFRLKVTKQFAKFGGLTSRFASPLALAPGFDLIVSHGVFCDDCPCPTMS
jgi:hypothetical protein